MKIIKRVRDKSGAKSLLALKCFSTWSVFDLMKQYMDGTTSSSLYEARLGHEKFGKETHVYCVAYSEKEIKEITSYADTIIFNSIAQLKKFHEDCSNKNLGIRINPKLSYSEFDLADPARRYSRLGVSKMTDMMETEYFIKGALFHFNCDNDSFENFKENLKIIGDTHSWFLNKLDWVSLGGGISFTKSDYPLDDFCALLEEFAKTFRLQVFLEPGEAAVTGSTSLITTVLDVVRNEKNIAIVDASVEAHMPDLLIYRQNAKIDSRGEHEYIIAGRSCLAGDVFGTYNFPTRLKPGSTITIKDAGGYTMVKKNWFNGLPMPSIAVKSLNGKIYWLQKFYYDSFLDNLS